MRRVQLFFGRMIQPLINITYWILLIFSMIIAIFPKIVSDKEIRLYAIMGLVAAIVLTFLILVIYFWQNTKLTLKIKQTKITIKPGTILGEHYDEKAIKVIPFNEYFDTIVDDIIIDKGTLNGIFINRFYKFNHDVLDNKIKNILQGKSIGINSKRLMGNKERYPLGTICKVDDNFALLALTKFTDDNRAHISLLEMVQCFLKMWDELDVIKGTNEIILPLIGSGITRIDDGIDFDNYDILSMLIYTFKISKLNVKEGITILISKDTLRQINLHTLKKSFEYKNFIFI